MPTYEYACEKCGERFEIFQSFSAKPLKKHPDCGGPVKKVFHARGVVFKGSGFYATDSKPKKAPASESSSTGSDTSAGESKSSESKSSESKSTPKSSKTSSTSSTE